MISTAIPRINLTADLIVPDVLPMYERIKRELEYIVDLDLKVYCATWNVNNCCYKNFPLQLWLSACDDPPDIYAIGFQELGMSPKTLFISENCPDADWVNALLDSVHLYDDYELLDSVRLVGMMLTVIIRKHIRPSVKRWNLSTVPRGFLNAMGNKGGVAISIQLYESSICFVNSHLAAHVDYVKERNDDYEAIMKELVFDDNLRTISDHEHIFWMGDLNYRLSESSELPTDSEEMNYEHLLECDQLTQEMRKNECFKGFSEGPIKFRPSFKYDVGTDTYDTSAKQRPPAYCDRILWKGEGIEQLSYNSVMDLRQSDHKPVYALFSVKVKAIDPVLSRRVHTPQVMLDRPVIDFGLVRFNDKLETVFKVFNSCAVIVNFWFNVKDPPSNGICEPWLDMEPKAEILPIDGAKDIHVTLHIDKSNIRGLLKKIRTTAGGFEFDELHLHVNDGHDELIPMAGEYKPSCYGLSMETLCRTNRPLADYTQAQLKELMNDESNEFRVSIPREFFLLIDYLQNEKELVGVFTSLDKYTHYNEVREWLDTWSYNEFPSTPQVAAEALLTLLDLPEEPLLHPLVENLLHTNSASEAFVLLKLLSAPKRNVFTHLCMFLRMRIKAPANDLQQIAQIFGRVLLRDDRYIDDDSDRRRREFMLRFIDDDTSRP